MAPTSRLTGKKQYRTPVLEELGTVRELTQVGQTIAGFDTLPGGARGKDGGSIYPEPL